MRVALSLAADFRRARNCLLRTVFCVGKPDSVSKSVFRFRQPLPCPTTEGNIYFAGKIAKVFLTPQFQLSTEARKFRNIKMKSGA
jgi:hypothetical protein